MEFTSVFSIIKDRPFFRTPFAARQLRLGLSGLSRHVEAASWRISVEYLPRMCRFTCGVSIPYHPCMVYLPTFTIFYH